MAQSSGSAAGHLVMGMRALDVRSSGEVEAAANTTVDNPNRRLQTIDVSDMAVDPADIGSASRNDFDPAAMNGSLGGGSLPPPILPPSISATQQQQRQNVLVNPSSMRRRPFEDLGAAADPLPFPPPRIDRGKRSAVLCFNPQSGREEVLSNVLFRDYSRECPDGDADSRVREAYWPIPYKEPIKTIMGHVEICIVLERCSGRRDEDDNDDNSSYDGGGDDDEEQDIVFQSTRKRVAVKVNNCETMDRLRNRHAEDPLKEIAAMQLIGESHPNVLGCQHVLFDGRNLNVVMRFCDSGDLFQLLQDRMGDITLDTTGMPEAQARYWFRQIIAGVEYLHSIGVTHRDLSPENVMIDGSNCMVIDMGMCLRTPYVDPTNANQSVEKRSQQQLRRRLFKPQGAAGKLPYMSPEVYRNRDNFDGEAADLWTTGTILFCMLTGNRSYQRPHQSDPQFYWMTRGLPQLLADWNVQLSAEGLHLLQNLLQVDPRLRLTLEEVLNHPWFQFADDSGGCSNDDDEFDLGPESTTGMSIADLE